MFLFSPGVAVAALIVLGIWVWLARKEIRIRWWWVAAAAVLIILAGLLFSQIVAGTLRVKGGPLANLVNWLKYSMHFGAAVTTLNSGWLQTIFEALPDRCICHSSSHTGLHNPSCQPLLLTRLSGRCA